MIPITDFVLHAPVPQTTIDAYRDRVHPEVIELWKTYGFGTFGNGFFRVIDPEAYERGIGDVIGKVTGDRIAIPIMVTGLADLITWDPGHGVVGIVYRDQRTTGIGSDVNAIPDWLDLDGDQYVVDVFDGANFFAAQQVHGPLAFDESFTYVPLLSLGGPKKVENLKPRKTIEAIRTMVELQGLIEH
ncbi:DUF1851 domain-containing protein [Agrococcus terreus]|uniref:GAD-like domain-containing protein n=1 Tax=Agrococcus terreus TaxID=574649 RepID=UPI00384F5ACA